MLLELVVLAGFEYAEAVQGFIKGYRRVFWQGSTGLLCRP
jgi:cation transport regulator ChaC